MAMDILDERDVTIGVPALQGTLIVPNHAKGLVIFAHGSGSSRFSPRNRYVADVLNRNRYATLLFDLLTATEAEDRRNVFDVELLARRVKIAVDWVAGEPDVNKLNVGLFGASTGAAAALIAAAFLGKAVSAVVSRGGRPDLAARVLDRVTAPTLLIVGGDDTGVIELNEFAAQQMACSHRLQIVPAAGHLFEEPGALDRVIEYAVAWYDQYLT
ncbi:MAG TPA: acyl-CoA thioester hydrolase/BAAT C-terminal domain-containing protein [Hyphomicrobium sp.]|nr:acyl-CoA thioester hydrolase/BAAT C-terminal domain-containing protein [Hyphomicrobium sp.]